jgi:DNA-binding NarL/FixJ family response regulator
MALTIAAVVDPETQALIERELKPHRPWGWQWQGTDLASALVQLRQNNANIVLVDMSVMGFDLKRTPAKILAQNSTLKIILLTNTLSYKDIISVLVAGAHGCMPRTSVAVDLDDAVQTVMANRVYISAAFTPNGRSEG